MDVIKKHKCVLIIVSLLILSGIYITHINYKSTAPKIFIQHIENEVSLVSNKQEEVLIQEIYKETNDNITFNSEIKLALDLKLPGYYIYDIVHEVVGGDRDFYEECKKNINDNYCDFMFTSKSHIKNPEDASLFVMPIFESSLSYHISLLDMMKKTAHNRYYLKYRGSNFIILCYMENCEHLANVTKSGLNIGIRAIWVDRGTDVEWPCQNRKFDISNGRTLGEIDWQKEQSYFMSILNEAGEMIKNRNIWKCEGKSRWGLTTTTKGPKKFPIDINTIMDTSWKSKKDKVYYCGVPKVGSSVAVLMMRRMNGMPNWKVENTIKIRDFNTGYRWKITDKNNLIDIFDQTDWIKGILVRDPISRILSAYRSKIENLKEYFRIPGGWDSKKGKPSFRKFIEIIEKKSNNGNIDWIDRHFRPQSALCGTRFLPYDFVGRYEFREMDIHDFLESIDLWEKIGLSGWGIDGTMSIYQEDEQIVRKNKLKPVTHADSKMILRKYYDEDLVKRVIKLFEEDFNRFGFSKDPFHYI